MLLEDNIFKEGTVKKLQEQIEKYKRVTALSPSALSNEARTRNNFEHMQSIKD